MKTSPDLRVNRLTLFRDYVQAGGSKVVSDFSFSLTKGRLLALTGEDGGGMSAIAQAIAGLLPTEALRVGNGEIFLDGEDLLQMSARKLCRVRRRKLAYFDRYTTQRLNPQGTIREHLNEALAWKNKTEREAGPNLIQGLYEVGLAEPESVLNCLPGELSAEILSRVVIAMALQAGVGFIVADEMTAHLDATVEQQILDLLVGLKNRQGLSILLVTHNPGIIVAVADEVVVMFEGTAIERGKVSDVLSSSASPYVKALMDCAPRLGEGRLRLGEISEEARQVVREPCGRVN